jgi:NAD(P)-dependent dehydrogenase (short-subunit alcohol dehydrogenase family)
MGNGAAGECLARCLLQLGCCRLRVGLRVVDGQRLGCLDGDLAAWQEVFAINFFAPVFFSRALAKHLERSGGAIVNVSSRASQLGGPGTER